MTLNSWFFVCFLSVEGLKMGHCSWYFTWLSLFLVSFLVLRWSCIATHNGWPGINSPHIPVYPWTHWSFLSQPLKWWDYRCEPICSPLGFYRMFFGILFSYFSNFPSSVKYLSLYSEFFWMVGSCLLSDLVVFAPALWFY